MTEQVASKEWLSELRAKIEESASLQDACIEDFVSVFMMIDEALEATASEPSTEQQLEVALGQVRYLMADQAAKHAEIERLRAAPPPCLSLQPHERHALFVGAQQATDPTAVKLLLDLLDRSAPTKSEGR